jgi:peptide/nickel transport system substrate-binding protein
MIARFLFVLLLTACVLVLAGCGKPGDARPDTGRSLPPSPLVAKCEPGRPGGRFVIAHALGPNTFNPLFATNNAADGITRLLFSSLVNMDAATQEPGPGLAESWSVAADQKTWTFNLRKGVRWSDGQPLTAADVAFTWNEIMYEPEYNRISFDLFRIGGRKFAVSKVDDFTVRVVTPEVFAPFVEFFGGVPILPEHILAGAVKEKVFPLAYGLKTPRERIVGSGPYRVKEVRPGQSTLLERNPEYWVTDRQGGRLPYFDEVMFTVASGAGAEARVFFERKSDVFESVRAEHAEQFKRASATGRFQLVELGVGHDRDFLWFNQNTGVDAAGKPFVSPAKLKWFRNRKFRQAVSCAVDRERIAREVYEGRAQPIYGLISAENQRWSEPNIPRYVFDPAHARTLLAEAGMQDRNGDGVLEDADGVPVEIAFHSNTGNPLREKTALMIQENLKQVGIKLIHVPIDFRGLLMKVNVTFDYEAALMGLAGGGGDPATQVNVLRSGEELHQWFPFQKTPATEWEARVDALMDKQMRTLDFAQRKKDFDEVQRIMAEEEPMVFIVSPFAYSAIRSGISNLRPAPMSPYHVTWNLDQLYFTKQ